MDAGFASGDKLTGLLEMGDALNTKAPNARITDALRAQLPRAIAWTRVGRASMIAVEWMACLRCSVDDERLTHYGAAVSAREAIVLTAARKRG